MNPFRVRLSRGAKESSQVACKAMVLQQLQAHHLAIADSVDILSPLRHFTVFSSRFPVPSTTV